MLKRLKRLEYKVIMSKLTKSNPQNKQFNVEEYAMKFGKILNEFRTNLISEAIAQGTYLNAIEFIRNVQSDIDVNTSNGYAMYQITEETITKFKTEGLMHKIVQDF